MNIRLFQPRDANRIARLFHDTVREINIRDYSIEQVKAWAPDDVNFTEFTARDFTYIAEEGELILGFADLKKNGHIDRFFCHKDYQGRGIGRQLYETIEAKALELGIDRLVTEASITARPFFERMGFSVIQTQQVYCRGQSFTNYRMEKRIRKEIPKVRGFDRTLPENER
ncbi:GNAT family N-acetyltransferase [Pannus brasiliensis CCIBt3594]|uniref:GNAT family N-acetyltransferase n=1 Tax=Pannus brasiliensis CCIBt3594 TaxID=1427578 RepID=A0AAW9QKH5_9CHRO